MINFFCVILANQPGSGKGAGERGGGDVRKQRFKVRYWVVTYFFSNLLEEKLSQKWYQPFRKRTTAVPLSVTLTSHKIICWR